MTVGGYGDGGVMETKWCRVGLPVQEHNCRIKDAVVDWFVVECKLRRVYLYVHVVVMVVVMQW